VLLVPGNAGSEAGRHICFVIHCDYRDRKSLQSSEDTAQPASSLIKEPSWVYETPEIISARLQPKSRSGSYWFNIRRCSPSTLSHPLRFDKL